MRGRFDPAWAAAALSALTDITHLITFFFLAGGTLAIVENDISLSDYVLIGFALIFASVLLWFFDEDSMSAWYQGYGDS